MSYDEQTTAGFMDLLDEEESYQQDAKLKTGISRTRVEDRPKKPSDDPNAKRWLFNPLEVIDLRNESASCGLDYLENIVFNPIKSIPIEVAKTDAMNLPEDRHKANNYEKFQRTAYMIATELCSKHGEKGVIDLNLNGMSDEEADEINKILFANAEDCCVFDVNEPEFPVPVLPTLMEVMDANLQAFVRSGAANERKTHITNLARAIRGSVTLAVKYARARINVAQERLLDEKSPNRTISPVEQRCYLALGEEIPNQMPFVTRSQHSTGVNTQAIAAATAAAVSTVMSQPGFSQAFAPTNPVAPVTADVSGAGDFSVGEDDLDAVEK